jgi:hypothetical protein
MKKTFTILAFATTLAVSAQIPTNGLVAYFPFTGNANDLSGNANNGTVNGATLTADRFGNLNSAYSFNGTSNYISVNDNASLRLTSFALSAWVFYSSNITTVSEILHKDTYPYNYGINSNANSKVAGFFGSNGSFQNMVSTTSSPFGQWHHIALTHNGTTAKLFVDNVFIDSLVAGNVTTSTGMLYIGALTGTQYFYNGKIDDIRIYNRAVNLTELNALYNEGVCFQSITVTDTLIINANITGFNPISYANTIKIFPNPTHDQITINYGNYSAMTGYTLKITNSLGQVMFTSPINQAQSTISLSTWTGNGIYFVNIIDATGNIIDIKKIVLQ